MASVYALGLIGGSIATIAASYYGNKLIDEKGVTSTSSESLEEPVQQPLQEPEPVQEPETVQESEPVQEPEPVQEHEPSSAVAPSLPEIDSMAGGGFGRPSWAPLVPQTSPPTINALVNKIEILPNTPSEIQIELNKVTRELENISYSIFNISKLIK